MYYASTREAITRALIERLKSENVADLVPFVGLLVTKNQETAETQRLSRPNNMYVRTLGDQLHVHFNINIIIAAHSPIIVVLSISGLFVHRSSTSCSPSQAK